MSRKTRRKNRKKKSSLMAAPEVAVTVAVATPKDSLMSPPEREGKAEGGIGGLDTYLDFLLRKQVGDAKVKANTKISNEERTRQLQLIAKNFNKDTTGFSSEVYREAAQMPLQEQIQRVNETLREQAKQFLMGERTPKAEGGEFPDLTGDGKVTQADVLHGRGIFQEGGEVPVDTYPNIPPEEMAAAKASQLPDEQMEDEFIDYVMNEALNPQEQTYLMNALEDDPQLSMIFDKVVGTASEFTGSGEVTGPGTGVSDSIPARLSDGEFVMTRKATDQIGAENLQRMMDDAERAYDGGLMKNGEEMERNINEVMMSANQMPSLNVRQR